MSNDLLIPYAISNVVAIASAIIAIRWPTVARVLLGFIFIGAAGVNSYTAVTNPGIYMTYGELTPIELYRSIIFGPFASHVQTYILIVAACQLFIGVFTLYKGQIMTVAMIGGIMFLIAIAPLGIGSAFPSTLIMALTFVILMQKKIDTSVYGLIRKKHKYSHEYS